MALPRTNAFAKLSRAFLFLERAIAMNKSIPTPVIIVGVALLSLVIGGMLTQPKQPTVVITIPYDELGYEPTKLPPRELEYYTPTEADLEFNDMFKAKLAEDKAKKDAEDAKAIVDLLSSPAMIERRNRLRIRNMTSSNYHVPAIQ
jgi:hypothetical protein